MTAWQEAAAPAPRDAAAAAARWRTPGTAWDDALAVIDTARKKQVSTGPRPAGTREEGARHPGRRMGRASGARQYPW